jgi:hypothetical protein
MSWADDIRCLYCDGRLPLYRKITNGQFCSTAHRKAYWVEQERLAVERLHQTHDSLRSYRPLVPIEAILGNVPAEQPAPEPNLSEQPNLIELQAEDRPAWIQAVNGGDLPVAGLMKQPVSGQPRWLGDRILGLNPDPLECSGPMRAPVNVHSTYDCGFEIAGAVRIDFFVPDAPAAQTEAALAPIAVAMLPVNGLALGATPVTPEWEYAEQEYAEPEPPEPEEEDPAPLCHTLRALVHPAPADRTANRAENQPLTNVMRAQLPLDAIRFHATLAPAALLQAGLREIPVDRMLMVPGPWIDTLRAIEVKADAPQFALSTPPLRPRLRLAAGRRYAVESKEAIPAIAVVDTSSVAGSVALSMPERDAKVLRAAVAQSAPKIQEPDPAGLVALACAEPSDSATAIRPAPTALSLPQPARTEPVRPISKLEPIDAKPVSDFVFAPPPAAPAPAPREAAPQVDKVQVWTHAIDFWNRAPRDLKMLVFAIPLLLGLAMHPSLPKVRVVAPAAASGFQKNFKHVVNQQWSSVRQSMLDRAAIALDEDFRTGLDDWVSRGDATTDWSFDATGFVKPGPLAMYRPSMGLADYQMQFLGMIDKKALSWVVRAVDFDNYYVIKLVVLKSGPLPTIGVTRYAVVDGKADARGDTIVPIDARPDSLYRVRLDVNGSDYALIIQGQMVDSWSEPRLTHGGVGFYAAPGEESRVRWVQVTHQYDMLGRLCAYLAPYNVASANSNWQQQ